ANDLPPWDRVQAFVNSGQPNGECGALSELVQTAALACAGRIADNASVVSNDAPTITSASDVGRLADWLAPPSGLVRAGLGVLYVEGVPQRAIDDFHNGEIGTGSKKGEHGAAYLKIEQGLAALPALWGDTADALRRIGGAIGAAQLGLAAARLDRDAA